jgi:hypothetical protein
LSDLYGLQLSVVHRPLWVAIILNFQARALGKGPLLSSPKENGLLKLVPTFFESASQCFSCVRLQVDALEREVENAREVERKLENKLMEVRSRLYYHTSCVTCAFRWRQATTQVWDSFQVSIQAGIIVCYLGKSAFLFAVYGSWLGGCASGATIVTEMSRPVKEISALDSKEFRELRLLSGFLICWFNVRKPLLCISRSLDLKDLKGFRQESEVWKCPTCLSKRLHMLSSLCHASYRLFLSEAFALQVKQWIDQDDAVLENITSSYAASTAEAKGIS